MVRFEIKQKPIVMAVEKAVTVGVAGKTYEGSYDVTPTVDGLTMNTKEKYMKENVNVMPIPYYDVSNTSGGTTVYIADELEVI